MSHSTCSYFKEFRIRDGLKVSITVNVIHLNDPVSNGLVANTTTVTRSHGDAPDAHVVHDGVGRHGPVVSEGPLVVVQVESSSSKLDRSVFPESEVSMIFPVLVWL